jgi:WASH complex subunit 7
MLNEKQHSFISALLTRHISKQICDLIIPQLEKMKKAASTSKGTEKSDTYSALQLILLVLKGPGSPIRVSTLNFCLNFALTKGVLKESDSVDLRYLIWKYEIIANFQHQVKSATDCGFIYWSKDLIPIFFSYLFQNPVRKWEFFLKKFFILSI